MSQETRHEIIEGIMGGSYPIDPREQSTTDARNKRHSARCNDSETNLQSYLFVMHNMFCVTTNTRIQPNHIMHICIPETRLKETFQICHRRIMFEHRGVKSTLDKFQRTFFVLSA